MYIARPSFCEIEVICFSFYSFIHTGQRCEHSYSRQKLLVLGSLCTSNALNFQLLPDITRTPLHSEPTSVDGQSWRRQHRNRKQKWGKHGGCGAGQTQTPHQLSLPSTFLANVQSLAKKLDELQLRITLQKWIKDCNIIVFTETWLNNFIPDSAIHVEGGTILRSDRATEDSGKSRGRDL